MSNRPDEIFCGHCGDRLPPFGGDLGYCSQCATKYRGVLRSEFGASTGRTRGVELQRWRDPILATLLGCVLPGAGQLYNGHFIKAGLVFVTSPFVIPWLIGIADAFFSARRINERIESPSTFASA